MNHFQVTLTQHQQVVLTFFAHGVKQSSTFMTPADAIDLAEKLLSAVQEAQHDTGTV